MNDARFKDLVNLYLDREINPRDFQLLRSELAEPERKRQFESLRRIHVAEKQALTIICGCHDEKRHSLTERASRAMNDARVHFEERRKGLVLLTQFTAATATIAVTVGLLYRESVESSEVESGPAANLAETPQDVRDRLMARLSALPVDPSHLIYDQQGRAIALVSFDQVGEAQVQPLQAVPEGNIFKLGRAALEAARPQFPDPSELLENRQPSIPVRHLPGTTAPIVLVEETQGAGEVVGYAY